jgi:cytoskeletal protein CcmA (bactofilin family)
MEIIAGIQDGPLVLTQDTSIQGTVKGAVVVLGAVRCEVHGTVNGDLVADPGSTVVIHGRVGGLIINNGGAVSLYGTAGGITGTHPTYVDEAAKVDQ